MGHGTEYNDFGPYAPSSDSMRYDTIRGFYSFYGPNKDRNTVTYDQDWGCPNQQGGGVNLDGMIGSAKFNGAVTLFVSKGPGSDFGTNDPNQPMSTSYCCQDDAIMEAAVSQYDETFMLQRYNRISEPHLPQSHAESVGDQYVSDWRTGHVDRDAGGGTGQEQGFGPYTLAPGDSIHIIFAEASSGISWEKCREVGENWYQYFTAASAPTLNPPLTRPPGYFPASLPYEEYTKAWIFTGVDSIKQTMHSALRNYYSGYTLPQPPPAPDHFIVTSGGDRINLQWSGNAAADPHFNGYVITRAVGSVKDFRTVYTKVFECDKSYTSNTWDDTSAVRGFNYYYSIQSKDDGTQNDLRPGTPLYSSMFLTLTSVAANLLRPAANLLGEIRVVPNPYDIRSRKWQFGDQFQYDRIVFYGLPPKCRLKIFTENGTKILEILHTNGSGDEIWDSKTSSGQVVVSGIYILYVEVTEDTYAKEDEIAKYDITDENLHKIYSQGQTMFQKGDKIFSAGQSTFRKFVIIR